MYISVLIRRLRPGRTYELRGIYEVLDEFDFSTDESVAARRAS